MPVNNFEKQVQGLMEEIKFPPSDSTWKKVEERISEKKKRRRGLVLFPLFAGILLLGYLAGNDGFRQSGKERSKADAGFQRQLPSNQDHLIEKRLNENNTVGENASTSAVLQKGKEAGLESSLVTTQQTGRSLLQSPFIRTRSNDGSTFSHSATISGEKPLLKIFVQSPAAKSEEGLEYSFANGFGALATLPRVDRFILMPSGFDGIKAEARTKIIKPMPRFGVYFSGGISGFQSAILGIEKPVTLADGIPDPTSGGVRYYQPPSERNAGPAFEIGITYDKPLSERSGVTAGLYYAYMSDRMMIGMRRDSVIRNSYSDDALVNTWYQGTALSEYRDRYHFAELPLHFYYKLTKGRMPLQASVGVSVKRLLSTNALVYDSTAGGVYYKDNNQLSKTQFAVNTGLAVNLSIGNLKATVGPQLNFSITDMFRNRFNGNKFLLYGGVGVRVYRK